MTAIFSLVSGFIIVLIVCLISARRRRKAFEERFLPISDAEFVARCARGTSPTVALKVRRLISDSLGVDHERIYPSTRLVEDLDVC
jgi:hypothetical protein